MFKSLRFRLTAWFTLLSALICLFLVLSGLSLFRSGLNTAIDEELRDLATGVMPSVINTGGRLHVNGWERSVGDAPVELMAQLDLLDEHGKLQETYGKSFSDNHHIPVVDHIIEVPCSGFNVRVLSMPIQINGKKEGYLQVQLPTSERQSALSVFLESMIIVVPLVLLLLVATGYFIAGRAVVPVEESFVVLRRFMSNASHELGTPLSIMQANLESLELDLEKKGQKVEKLEVVNRSVERMKTLVADLNLLARVENPHHVLPRQNINMQDLIRVIMAEYSQAFCDKNIQLKEGQIQSIVVNGHADSIKRVFLNLLQNALRYTNAGGTVTVNCTASDKLCRLSVSDTGIGITKEDLPHIFERFYRSDVARERSSNGSGLGLSIVKAVAIWHGGKVEVHSKLDAGTTFVVSLPIS